MSQSTALIHVWVLLLWKSIHLLLQLMDSYKAHFEAHRYRSLWRKLNDRQSNNDKLQKHNIEAILYSSTEMLPE